MLEGVERRISGMENEDEGSFVVACHESLGAYFLPAFIYRGDSHRTNAATLVKDALVTYGRSLDEKV